MNENPDKLQTIDPDIHMQTYNKILSLEEQFINLQSAFRVMSETLAANMKQSIDMNSSIQDYIGEQMSYRIYRQNLEENNINLQLAQKNLELQFLQKKYDSLNEEKQEDEQEADNMRIEREKLKLEVETLKNNLGALHSAKNSTKDKIATLKLGTGSSSKVRDTVVYTAIGTATAATVGGFLAFVVWMVRFYVMNTP